MTRLYILPLLSLLFVSCDKGDDLVNSGELTNSTPISIEVSQKAITRGAMVNDQSKMGSVGLYCEYTGSSDWDSGVDFDKMPNTKFEYKSGKWETNTPEKWGHESLTDKYSFNAYSPFEDVATNGIDPEIVAGELSITYTMPTTCADQPDLMIATPRKNIYPQTGGKVHMVFNHALAAIGFKVKGETTMKLLSVTIKNLPSTATLTHDGTSCVWSSLSGNGNFEAAITATKPTSETTADLVTKDNGYIMAIPQITPSNAVVEIGYSTKGDNTADKIETLPLPDDTKWEASHQYLYTITLEELIKLELTEWNNVDPNDTEDSITDTEDGYDVDGYDKNDNITDTI